MDLMQGALDHLSKPDPIAWMSLDIGNGNDVDFPTHTLATDENNQEDTFLPDFPLSRPSYRGVPLRLNTRLTITMEDADAFDSNCPMGTAVIGYEHLRAAFDARGSGLYPVRVDDQTHERVVFVMVSVNASE